MRNVFLAAGLLTSVGAYAGNTVDVKLLQLMQVHDSDKILAQIAAYTTADSALTRYTKTTAAYELKCTKDPITYKLSLDYSVTNPNTFSGFKDSFSIGNEDTGRTLRNGYPMPQSWEYINQNPQQNTVLCLLEYQAVAGYSTWPITFTLSDPRLPLSASWGNITTQRSVLKSDIIYMRRRLIDNGDNCFTGLSAGLSAELLPDNCYNPFEDPLIIDLGQDGIHLGEAGIGVAFDMNADGQRTTMQWVEDGGNEAFLVRDLNGNGNIDNGSELFGNGTIMVPHNAANKHLVQSLKATEKQLDSINNTTLAPNGFVALAQYDQVILGGNDDGVISADDAIWPELQLWLDGNADGLSGPAEMLTLETIGITHLNIIPKENNRNDPAGNLLPLWAWATDDSRNQHNKYKMVDVFFKTIE